MPVASMNFRLGETDDEIRLLAADFAGRQVAPGAASRDRTGLFPAAELRALADLGFLGLIVPEVHGGAGAGPVAQAAVVAELAMADASVAVTMAVTSMVAEVLSRHGTEAACGRILPRILNGDAVAAAFALSEPQSGSDAGAMTTTAREVPGGWSLTGAKQWITSGDKAGVIVIMARHPGTPGTKRKISAFVVEQGAPGLRAGNNERKMGQRGSSTVSLVLDDVFVPQDQLLGTEGEGLRVALTALDSGRIGVAAQAVGIGRAALMAAVTYAKVRRQFSSAIADFQAVRMMLADAAVSLEAAWLLTLAAAQAKARGDADLTRKAAQAKLFATERSLVVCDHAIQIHGGYGFCRDMPVERLFRDVRVTTIYEGTSQIQRLVIAREILKHAARQSA